MQKGRVLTKMSQQNQAELDQQTVAEQPQLGHTAPQNVASTLQFLTPLDHLYVKQNVEQLEAISGFETKNNYTIKDAQGRDLCTAREEIDSCARNCWGRNRPLELQVKDMNGREIMLIMRPLDCTSCGFSCCLQSTEVEAPPGNLVGFIEQEFSVLTPTFLLKNKLGETALRIKSPLLTCGDVEFQVLSGDGATQVGTISKKWSGLAKEALTDAENFSIEFPMDLDVKMKATTLGACFLIDFMFFERM